MPGDTGIEWTRGDDGSKGASWNPVTGCTPVSAGCDHCYAQTFAERWRGIPGHPYEQGFDLKLWPERLAVPLGWQKPRRIFVNSMSDLFHADVPGDFIASVFAVMAAAKQHTFMVLTKRPQRMTKLLSDPSFPDKIADAAEALCGELGWCHLNLPEPFPWPLPNVWLGVSVENQAAAFRIDVLAKTPAAVRFLSCEPLIGPLDLSRWLMPVCPSCKDGMSVPVEGGGMACPACFDAPGGQGAAPPAVDWVIVGGESGAGHRPIDPNWVMAILRDCEVADVPFFFKQWGGLHPKAGGNLLYGNTYAQFPVARS